MFVVGPCGKVNPRNLLSVDDQFGQGLQDSCRCAGQLPTDSGRQFGRQRRQSLSLPCDSGRRGLATTALVEAFEDCLRLRPKEFFLSSPDTSKPHEPSKSVAPKTLSPLICMLPVPGMLPPKTLRSRTMAHQFSAPHSYSNIFQHLCHCASPPHALFFSWASFCALAFFFLKSVNSQSLRFAKIFTSFVISILPYS